MSRVFLYGRVSTSDQSLEQQERTVYEWLNNHNMSVDEIVSDEGVSGGVSYADRKLGKELIPRMKEGDVLIVSEISRLGRSMYDLSKLIHDELKPRKLRLIVVGMGIDLNCANITPIDQLILSNFSFAAELEKHLIRERTLSSLRVKRQQGVKFGAANPKYVANRQKKDKSIIIMESRKRGETKRLRYQQSRDVQAFLQILKHEFPSSTDFENPSDWVWEDINTKNGKKHSIISLMKTAKELDETGKLFTKWDFTKDDRALLCKLCSYLATIKSTFKKNNI